MDLKIRAWLALGFLLIICNTVNGQNQKIVDSLELIYEEGNYEEGRRLEILYNLAKDHPDPEWMLFYSAELLDVARELNSSLYIFRGYLETGTGYRLKGDPSEALTYHFKALEVATVNQLKKELGNVHVAIADDYSEMGDTKNAVTYYRSGIKILREENESLSIATALFNFGDEYFNHSELDSALLLYQESAEIFNAFPDQELPLAYILGNVGLVHAQMGENYIAERDINQAIQMLEELGDFYGISVYLIYMSDIYTEKGDTDAALNYAQRALDLALQHGLKGQIRDANLKLFELHEKKGNLGESIKHYKDYNAYKDSVNSIAAVQEIADLRTVYEVAQKQAEVDLLVKESEIAELKDIRQNFVIYASILLLAMGVMLAIAFYRRHQYVRKTKRIIEIEKNKSEDLLLNILPQETARELREFGKVKARKIESATVLFTDFVEFTKLSEHVEPEQMVRSIDNYFKKFDEITTRHNLEKIKTIGDSYMCAGGLHSENSSQAKDVLIAAKEMIDVINKEKDSTNDYIHFDIRIGIHTGRVVAGIVGTKKWQYDIWGDTVNIASRMESNSKIGRINLSASTYNEIKDEFPCEYRGVVDVKNHGRMKMYFLSY